MKTTILTLASLLFSAGAALADPVEGRWRTQADDNGNSGIIEISLCGQRLCGTLIESRRANGEVFQSAHAGRQIVWDMEPRGNGAYRDGQVYSPDRDQTYRAHMDMAGNSLTVAGCVMRVICRDQVWTRAN